MKDKAKKDHIACEACLKAKPKSNIEYISFFDRSIEGEFSDRHIIRLCKECWEIWVKDTKGVV